MSIDKEFNKLPFAVGTRIHASFACPNCSEKILVFLRSPLGEQRGQGNSVCSKCRFVFDYVFSSSVPPDKKDLRKNEFECRLEYFVHAQDKLLKFLRDATQLHVKQRK